MYTLKYDKTVKFKYYEKNGVSEYWLVSPREQTIEVYTFTGSMYELHDIFYTSFSLKKTDADNHILNTTVLPDICMNLNEIWKEFE